jgi:hypothetical protein
MSEPTVKARPCAPVNGKPAWHGMYLRTTRAWEIVRNINGEPIVYATPEAACAAAWLEAP